ncbi:hypothetical protein BDQ17DRAFT_1371586 [Cyathus striatus]|nr:hypothetical protein BDQ17DRAFT_1371586 [Cyathus striatus]
MSNSNTTNPPTNILAPWLLPRLTNLYTTLPTEQDDSNFEASFLETFAQSAKVVANHEDTTLDALREHIGAGKFAMARADVDFRDVIEIVKEGGGDKEGLVAGFFVVTRDLKFRIRAGPARRSSFNSFSAKIESDTSIPTTLGDRRRVTEFFITLVDYAAPVHFAHPTGAGASTEVKTVRPEDVEQH